MRERERERECKRERERASFVQELGLSELVCCMQPHSEITNSKNNTKSSSKYILVANNVSGPFTFNCLCNMLNQICFWKKKTDDEVRSRIK